MYPLVTLFQWPSGMFRPPLLPCNANMAEHHFGL